MYHIWLLHWKLKFQECEKYFRNKRDDDLRYQVTSGIFSMLEQVHHIAETKVFCFLIFWFAPLQDYLFVDP